MGKRIFIFVLFSLFEVPLETFLRTQPLSNRQSAARQPGIIPQRYGVPREIVIGQTDCTGCPSVTTVEIRHWIWRHTNIPWEKKVRYRKWTIHFNVWRRNLPSWKTNGARVRRKSFSSLSCWSSVCNGIRFSNVIDHDIGERAVLRVTSRLRQNRVSVLKKSTSALSSDDDANLISSSRLEVIHSECIRM